MKHLNPKQAHEFLQANPEAVFVDVRSEIEYLFVGHPEGSIHDPLDRRARLGGQPRFRRPRAKRRQREPPVVLICRSGRRSVDAGLAWKKPGFRRFTTCCMDSRATWTKRTTAIRTMAGALKACLGSRPDGVFSRVQPPQWTVTIYNGKPTFTAASIRKPPIPISRNPSASSWKISAWVLGDQAHQLEPTSAFLPVQIRRCAESDLYFCGTNA